MIRVSRDQLLGWVGGGQRVVGAPTLTARARLRGLRSGILQSDLSDAGSFWRKSVRARKRVSPL